MKDVRIMVKVVDTMLAHGIDMETALKIAVDMLPILEGISEEAKMEEKIIRIEEIIKPIPVKWAQVESIFGIDQPSPMEKYFVNPTSK